MADHVPLAHCWKEDPFMQLKRPSEVHAVPAVMAPETVLVLELGVLGSEVAAGVGITVTVMGSGVTGEGDGETIGAGVTTGAGATGAGTTGAGATGAGTTGAGATGAGAAAGDGVGVTLGRAAKTPPGADVVAGAEGTTGGAADPLSPVVTVVATPSKVAMVPG